VNAIFPAGNKHAMGTHPCFFPGFFVP